MVLARHVWLLAGLMPSFGLAQTANLNIWDVDKSCQDNQQYVQDSMDIALEMATAAKESLEFVAKAYPSNADDKLKWKTIFKALSAVFGVQAEYAQQDVSSGQIGQAYAVFSKMVSVMPSQHNDPSDGYVSKLRAKIGHKPKIMCTDKEGPDSWQWYGENDKIPGKDKTLMQENDFTKFFLEGAVGAWIYDSRYAFKTEEKETPILCVDGMKAAVYWDKDIVIFCDEMFNDDWKNRPTPKALKSGGISAGDDIGKHSETLPYVMVHELAHWFGGKDFATGKVNVVDHIAVTREGKLVYRVNGVKQEFDSPPPADPNTTPVLTYGRERVWYLARPHTTYPDNSGPAKALTNADSFSLFAFMMYLDKWDWADKGIAKVPADKKRKDPPN
ncbi:hypothetical protein F53441_2736 [Fusarium austroafricanum]|uniref:Lysine-specific metallo-endopeptidase domain-containing protein n=1 Tax=Fusarium austroafricanum TaxID=2364996 RepID=A0A8H4KQR9_9HYPO|nr:hypothetical protein F53441_2736 [Fusarium austroafricanum]